MQKNIWNVYLADGIQVLYSSKINVKQRLIAFSMQEIKEIFERLILISKSNPYSYQYDVMENVRVKYCGFYI